MFCFLCALFASLFGTKRVSADAPLAAIKTSSLVAAPAAVLGISNTYVVAAAAGQGRVPQVLRFSFSEDLVDFAQRVEKLARDGVLLNQRKIAHPEKLNLRVQSRLGGGVVQLCYRR
jgi:hypothetical protein